MCGGRNRQLLTPISPGLPNPGAKDFLKAWSSRTHTAVGGLGPILLVFCSAVLLG